MNQPFQEIKLTNSVRFSLKLVMKNFLFDVCLWNDTIPQTGVFEWHQTKTVN